MIKKEFPYSVIKLLGIIFILLYALSCKFLNEKDEPAELRDNNAHAYDWPTATLNAVGIKPVIIDNAIKMAANYEFINSILVIKNGLLVSENYFNGCTKTYADRLCSVTKSFTSTMVGLALQQGHIHNLDEKMLDFFKEHDDGILDKRKYEISIRHLLSMSAGFDEGLNEMNPQTVQAADDYTYAWKNSMDPVEMAIKAGMTHNPGEIFNYFNPQSHLLSAVITRTTGLNAWAYARQTLFDSLKIQAYDWEKDPQGNSFGHSGMMMTPRDMARLGLLFLQEGEIDNVRVLNKDWVSSSTARIFENALQTPLGPIGYGYQWWSTTFNGFTLNGALGYGGQFIIIVDSLDLVLVATAESEIQRETGDLQGTMIFGLLVNQVVTPLLDIKQKTPYKPIEVWGEKILNKAKITAEYVNHLRWKRNPIGTEKTITGYRIYKISNTGKADLLEELDSGARQYIHRNRYKRRPCFYGISTVTRDSRESEKVFVFVL